MEFFKLSLFSHLHETKIISLITAIFVLKITARMLGKEQE